MSISHKQLAAMIESHNGDDIDSADVYSEADGRSSVALYKGDDVIDWMKSDASVTYTIELLALAGINNIDAENTVVAEKGYYAFGEPLENSCEKFINAIEQLAEALTPFIIKVCHAFKVIVRYIEKCNGYLVLSLLGNRAFHFYKNGSRRVKNKYINRAVKKAGLT